ncbi:holin family protein [bacterium]|nr:holin family protein [bacterium]
MGLIGDLFGIVLGGGRNAIRETVEVFRPNAEADAVREAAHSAASLAQFAAEFAQPKAGLFDRFIDGLNRLPRPMLALGTLALFVSAMVDPVWFSQRMQGIALVPEPLWWLMGAIVSFYFGARHQAKTYDLQKSLAATLARTPEVAAHIRALEALRSGGGEEDPLAFKAEDRSDVVIADGNQALKAWSLSRDR